jgi:hypothetical protein
MWRDALFAHELAAASRARHAHSRCPRAPPSPMSCVVVVSAEALAQLMGMRRQLASTRCRYQVTVATDPRHRTVMGLKR